MNHSYYSQRKGTNPNPTGLPIEDIANMFVRIYDQLREDGFFDEAFGFECVDDGYISGTVRDVELEILLRIRKSGLWPLGENAPNYSEDDFFDMVEFLFQHVSEPVDGSYHSWNNCGMHWETFSKDQGQTKFRERVNDLLSHYARPFELSSSGEVLHKPEAGFEPIFDADIPSEDDNVTGRINAAVVLFRRHGSTQDNRRQAVRDLADVLEYLRPKVKSLLTSSDERDLFNIANNFGIRHHNDEQKTAYEAGLWLSWMFYFYLATVHVVLRKLQQGGE